MVTRLRIAVLFGGRSSEHEVSIMSARNVVRALDAQAYEIVPVAVTRAGKWLLVGLEAGEVPAVVPDAGTELCLLPGGRGRMVAVPQEGAPYALAPVDVVYPVLHGPFGEDGSVQGYAEVADVAYVGSGILGSAAAMDKDIAKRLLAEAGLNVARSATVFRGNAVSFADVTAALGLPLFVKPARQGSSVGVGKVRTEEEFHLALDNAFVHDDKVLIEAFVDGREIECAVLEQPDGSLLVSLPGEIAPAESHGFYSYEAKYLDADGAALSIPANLPEAFTGRLQALARRAFTAVGCEGMARVDFFVKNDFEAVVNEINTLPGFTDISMYPKAFDVSGIANRDLVDRLVAHALARAGRSRAGAKR